MRGSVTGLSLLLLGSLVAGSVPLACTSPVPATVTRGPTSVLNTEPTMLVRAPKQAERIAQSLRDAGLMPATAATGANYELTVSIGRSRRTRPCGPLANVSYILSHNASRVLVIKGRGQTGTCSPNILDDMSRRLASFFPKRS